MGERALSGDWSEREQVEHAIMELQRKYTAGDMRDQPQSFLEQSLRLREKRAWLVIPRKDPRHTDRAKLRKGILSLDMDASYHELKAQELRAEAERLRVELADLTPYDEEAQTPFLTQQTVQSAPPSPCLGPKRVATPITQADEDRYEKRVKIDSLDDMD